MPELPEVQTVVDDLIAAGIVGATITGARVYWARSIDVLTPRSFCRRMIGRRIGGIRRRGKFIVFDFDGGGHLLVHLRMTGQLQMLTAAAERLKHQHVILDLERGRQLRFHDTRKFGRLYLVADDRSVLDKLGPEPLAPSFTARRLAYILRKRRRLLKPLLLDQTFIAGLGNIYVDEALWDARIHPARIASDLNLQEVRRLHRAIRRVLRRGLKNLGTTLGPGRTHFYSVGRRPGRNMDQLKVFRRNGDPCPRCRTAIRRLMLGQRSTHVCPHCQPEEG